MIKNLPTMAVHFILFIFNSMWRIGYSPASLKLSDLVMIPKPGKVITQVSSYRPIFLLPIISKLFERLLIKRLEYTFENGYMKETLEDRKYFPEISRCNTSL